MINVDNNNYPYVSVLPKEKKPLQEQFTKWCWSVLELCGPASNILGVATEIVGVAQGLFSKAFRCLATLAQSASKTLSGFACVGILVSAKSIYRHATALQQATDEKIKKLAAFKLVRSIGNVTGSVVEIIYALAQSRLVSQVALYVAAPLASIAAFFSLSGIVIRVMNLEESKELLAKLQLKEETPEAFRAMILSILKEDRQDPKYIRRNFGVSAIDFEVFIHGPAIREIFANALVNRAEAKKQIAFLAKTLQERVKDRILLENVKLTANIVNLVAAPLLLVPVLQGVALPLAVGNVAQALFNFIYREVQEAKFKSFITEIRTSAVIA